jgi:hypothetical protein
MENHADQFWIVPILVGSLNAEREALYGRILAPYLNAPDTLFVISSDFCHWGQRFRYTFYERSWGQIYESIEKLDRMGMSAIEQISLTGKQPLTFRNPSMFFFTSTKKRDLKIATACQDS